MHSTRISVHTTPCARGCQHSCDQEVVLKPTSCARPVWIFLGANLGYALLFVVDVWQRRVVFGVGKIGMAGCAARHLD